MRHGADALGGCRLTAHLSIVGRTVSHREEDGHCCKHQHNDGAVHSTDNSPATEPHLAVPAKCLQGTPESMIEMEPQCCQPYQIHDGVTGATEGVGNESRSVSGSNGTRHAYQFGVHHVVPEVVQMQTHAKNHDNAQHEHVLAGPLHLCRLVGHSITITTACFTVLDGEPDGIDKVESHQGRKTQSCHHSIPVGTEKLTNHVVTLCAEEGHHIHRSMECQKQDKSNASHRHHHFPADG